DQHCCAQLQAEGVTATLLDAEQALARLQQGELVDQVLMLPSAVDSCYAATLGLQQARIGQLSRLVQAAEGVAGAPAWRVLTRGVGAQYRYDDGVTLEAQEAAPDAALWGFTRTLMNELGEGCVALLDLPLDDAALSHWWPALQLELLAPDREAELFIAADGARHAPRLRLEPRPGDDVATGSEHRFTLGFELPGQLRNLRWEQHTLPAPATDEIEVAVKATGLNFRDVMYTLGLLSDEAIENGFAGPTLGLEFAGTVTRVGADIDSFQVGDSVVGFGPASFSSRVLTRTQAVTRIPAGLSFEAAATIPCTFFTVYYALHYLARLQPGERVLIHGAAGGVGIAAIQVAQWLGAEIYATAGSDEKRDFLRLLGVEHIYDSRALQFADQILADTPDGRGVDVVLNSLAGEAINRNLRILKPMGRFLELGKRDFYENTHIGLRPFRNNISYFGIDSDQVMQECPELTQRLFGEMMALFEDGVFYPLPFTSFDANHVEEAFRYMQQARQIGKVVVTYAQGVANPVALERGARPVLQLCADASYLVTGGLGGFGLRTARWLAEKGARHLLLISRSGAASDEAQQALAEFAAAGVAVTAEACDVADGAALEALLARCGDTLPPLRGVVHAATVIDDALIRNLSTEQIERVLTPKIAGAMQLDRLTRELELDLFVLYSSATTLMGNPGQSVYVAANHWLEALAAARRQRGLPATCARWGAIDDVGFLARNEKIKEALQSRMGGGALSAAVALDALEQMLLAQSTTLGVMELEWGALQRFLPSAEQPKFREIALAAEDTGAGSDEQVDIQQLIDSLSEQELQQTIAAMLAHELSRILLIPEEQVDVERSVYDMGLDSLMGVELMVAIESRFGINVPVMVLSEAPTLNKLSAYLIAQLRGDSDDSEPDQMTRTALQHGVSGEELVRLQTAPQVADKARLIQ
ncbi:MAG TPA: SDR family NAD(P)-dependent oxidoreductase, partial [Motiliproteus sp.]